MKVKIVNKSKHNLPAYATEYSAGMDLHADTDEDYVLRPFERHLFPTGIYIALPIGYEAQIRPRSGMACKFGVTVSNAPGTIDADYRGEIMVSLNNTSNEPYIVKAGDRIAQMVVAKHERVEWDEVHDVIELGTTERGDGGFGHTGTK